MRPEDARDQAVEHLLRRSFETGGRVEVSPDCLDAETFAAWTDGALDTFQLKTVEAHLADCTRCRAMAAVVTRVTPDPPVVMPWWRRSLRSAWLVPLTAGAAAVALWSVVPKAPADVAQQTTAVGGSAVERATPESKAPPQPALADRFEASADAKAKADPSTAGGAGSTSSLRANRQRVVVTGAAPQPIDEKRERVATRDQPRRAAPEEATDRLAAAASPPTPTPPAPRIPATLPAPAAAASPALPPPPPQPRPAAAAPDAPRFRELAGALMQQYAVTREIASPIATVRWRLGAGGAIDRTDDGGKTWRRLTSGVTVDLIAGASPSPSICWVVGRDSTVLRTTDGLTWGRVNIPEAADLVSVEAVDASTAIVATSDGRRFRTSDGGRTWIK